MAFAYLHRSALILGAFIAAMPLAGAAQESEDFLAVNVALDIQNVASSAAALAVICSVTNNFNDPEQIIGRGGYAFSFSGLAEEPLFTELRNSAIKDMEAVERDGLPGSLTIAVQPVGQMDLDLWTNGQCELKVMSDTVFYEAIAASGQNTVLWDDARYDHIATSCERRVANDQAHRCALDETWTTSVFVFSRPGFSPTDN